MKAFFIIFLLLPSLLFAQNETDSYSIYSGYLRIYKIQQPSIKKLVVKQSAKYGRKYNEGDVSAIADMFKNYLKSDNSVLYREEYQTFAKIIKEDTIWLALIDELEQKMKKKHEISNEFSKDLDISLLNNHSYNNYFNGKDLMKDWVKFHTDYPKSLLIELSEIVNDDKRAVFYFSGRCGGLCGTGELVLFYKKNSEWKFLQTLLIWQS